MLHRAAKEGLGAAYLHGFRVALDRGYDVIGEMDADGSHQPEQLHRSSTRCADADLVIGSRWVPGGSIVNWPLPPRAALARRELLHPDPARHQGARRHGRLPPVPSYDAGGGSTSTRSQSAGYVFQADLAFRTLRAGLRVIEVPIEFVERERGDSKMSRQRGHRVAASGSPAGGCASAPTGGRALRGCRRRAESRNSHRSPGVEQVMSSETVSVVAAGRGLHRWCRWSRST